MKQQWKRAQLFAPLGALDWVNFVGCVGCVGSIASKVDRAMYKIMIQSKGVALTLRLSYRSERAQGRGLEVWR